MFRTIFLEAVNGMAPIHGRTNMIRHTTLALAFAAAAIATPVAAAIKIATYSGSAVLVDDVTGVFGAAGVTLNLPYVVTFKYDTSIGRGTFVDDDGFSYDELFGGDDLGGPTPILDAALTINGITRRFGSQSSEGTVGAYEFAFGIRQTGQYASDNLDNSVRNFLGIGAFGFDLPLSLDTNYTGIPNRITGGFQIRTVDAFGSVTSYAYGDLRSPDGSLSISNAVPEPASWAMMIAGFGMIGGAMRRRAALLA